MKAIGSITAHGVLSVVLQKNTFSRIMITKKDTIAYNVCTSDANHVYLSRLIAVRVSTEQMTETFCR